MMAKGKGRVIVLLDKKDKKLRDSMRRAAKASLRLMPLAYERYGKLHNRSRITETLEALGGEKEYDAFWFDGISAAETSRWLANLLTVFVHKPRNETERSYVVQALHNEGFPGSKVLNYFLALAFLSVILEPENGQSSYKVPSAMRNN